MLENETYACVSYSEVKEAQIKVEEAYKEYKRLYENFLITCLCEAGFSKGRVRHKKTGIVGVLEVGSKSFYRPYEIKFFPIRKDGNISLKSKYYGFTHEERLTKELKEMFELAGE